MKKSSKILIAIIFFGAFIGVSIPFTLIIFSGNNTPSQSNHVNIYVNSNIYSQIFTELNQYKQDVINQGYTVDLINWSDNNIINLRNHLINASQQPKGLFGAVLIGDFPIIHLETNDPYFGAENSPTDLFLMDLDGQWTNSDIDANYESHTDGSGDIYPEIWIGRINPECLNNVNHSQAYKDYFNRNHQYRIGNLIRPHSQLIYIDEPWANDADTSEAIEWINDITGYTNKTSIYTPNAYTNETDYKFRLGHSYEFVHLFVHSDNERHYFGGDGSQGDLNYTEVLNLHTRPLFYNLFACYACRITYSNNLGTQYLFSNNTLVVIGSTKSGGMTMNSFFYNPLKNGKVFGEAFRVWFWNDDGVVSHGPDDPWSIGMLLLGDPLLTIYM